MRDRFAAALASVLLLVCPQIAFAVSVNVESGAPLPERTVAAGINQIETCNSGQKTAGRRVSDSSVTTPGSILAGGGASSVSVECDGTNWIVRGIGGGGGGGSDGITNATEHVFDADNATGAIADGAGWCVNGGSGTTRDNCFRYDLASGTWILGSADGSVISTPNVWSFGAGIAVAGSDPEISFYDDQSDGDPYTRLYTACTNVLDGAEDCGVFIDSVLNGAAITSFEVTPATGAIEIGDATTPTITLRTAGGGNTAVALPTGSIGSLELLDGAIVDADAAAEFTRDAEWDTLSEIDAKVADTIASSNRLDTEAEVRATALKVVPRPDAAPATGQAVRFGGSTWEYFAPVEDMASLNGRTTYNNFPANPVVLYYPGTPTGNVACAAGSGQLDPTSPTELGRKIVWDTSATPDEAWICTGTGNAATATWGRLAYSTGTPDTTWRIDSDNGGAAPADGSGIVIDGGSGTDISLAYSSGYGAMALNAPTEATFGGGLILNDGAAPAEWPWLWLSPSNFNGTSGSGNPGIRLCDPDADEEGDGCLEIEQNCGNVTATAEDCEATFYQRSNGTRQAMLTIEGDELNDAIARTVFHTGVRFEHHIIIPNGSNPNLASADTGRMTVDTTETQLLIANGGATPNVYDERRQRDFSIQSPTARTLAFYRAYAAETIASINCITDTGTATLSIQECDGTGASCAGVDGSTEIVCDSNNQADDGSLSNPTIDTGDWVKIVISAVGSSPTDLAISVGYKMTRK